MAKLIFYDDVHRYEVDGEEIHLRVILMDHRGNEIHTAGTAAQAHKLGVGKSGDAAGDQGSENTAGAVGGFVGKPAQVYILQHDQRQGEGCYIQHTPGSKRFTHFPKGQPGQGNVDQQAQVSQIDAEDVLDHGADAVDTGGGETVWEDKQPIVQSGKQSKGHNEQVGNTFSECLHDLSSVL